MSYEYIMSGLSFTKLVNNFTLNDKNTTDTINRILSNRNSVNNFKISSLFNAYLETRIGTALMGNHSESFNSIYGDSGGLQVITCGDVITPELKARIYDVQSKYCKHAMCFDEIPLEIDNRYATSANRTTISNKTFVVDNFKSAGVLTGKNINEQLRYFADTDSDTKVMMIAQGNSPQEFADFIHWSYDEIDLDLRDRIGGVSIAGSCIGNDVLESCDMMASYQLMELPQHIKDNIHLLGVGSISRFAPAIELSRSGFIPSSVNISLDSTSHTSSLDMGKFIDNKGISKRLGKTLNPSNNKFFKDVYHRYIKDEFDYISEEEFIKMSITFLNTTKHSDNLSESEKRVYYTMYFFSAVLNVERFMNIVDDCTLDQQNYSKYLNRSRMKKFSPLLTISGVRDIKDYYEWNKKMKRFIPSKRIQRIEPYDEQEINLAQFFA